MASSEFQHPPWGAVAVSLAGEWVLSYKARLAELGEGAGLSLQRTRTTV